MAAIVFSGLLCTNLFVFGHLIFLDLGHRLRKEVASNAQHRAWELAKQLADQGQIELYRVRERMTVISKYVDQVLTGEQYVTTVTLIDAGGRPVYMWTGRGGRIFQSEPGFHQPLRDASLVETGEGDAAVTSPPAEAPTFRVDTRQRDRYVAVPIPGAGQPGGAVEVGIDEDRLGREIENLRRALLIKIAAGAAISIALLLVAFIYVIRLISKTRRLEAEAQMADRLAYVGTLASGLAHEIRNPLNAMNMNLQMLEEELGTGSAPPEAEALLTSTKGEVRRLESLVNEFLSYARPAAPRFEQRDVNRTVEELVRFLRPELQQSGISITTTLSDSIPLVEIDEAQIRQALLNILINAKDVLGAGGRISVSTTIGQTGEVLIRIADNGPGIPPESRERIFEVFFSTRGGGTGLGLPIAQRILESHGGWIELETEVGEGTTFTLHLPRIVPAEARPNPVVAHAR